MPVLPGAEAFSHDAGRTGMLLCHGLTGSPQSLRPWANYLADAGLTVRLPRLPGHGTVWRELNLTRWVDWYTTVERSLFELRERCDEVFVGGLSMGGTLTLRLAEQHPDLIAGIVLVNPSLGTPRLDAKLLPIVSRLVPSTPGIASDIKLAGSSELGYDRLPLKAAASLAQLWKLTRGDLALIRCPVLTFRSKVDHVVEPLSGRLLLEGASSTEVTEVVLADSYHVATLDNDAPMIFERSLEFVRAHGQVPS